MAVYFTSDTHFGDPRVLRIDRRPFPDLASHDAALIEAWNETVGPDDEVWHLGDFCLAKPAERASTLLSRLNGRKHLIIGNNDGPSTLENPAWASVGHYRELELDGTHLVLCHYPFRTWNHMGKGWIDLHGHSHGKLKPMPRQFDVGVDVFGFRPVPLPAILSSRTRKAAARA
ncbi:metallophosphoesterase family protein [Chthonobacter albigriseus]|uniref:metallophosphoesterase family protein n=1 Tax=Chthonobacter albigriseus TaxID=1683161 RepID=UPI0015EE6FD9|nr:metallophosphoesterase family protein [Chthonobacter albigriseus]